MKKAIGIILIIGGMFMLPFWGINIPQQKMIADTGPVEMNKEENNTIEWPIYGAGLALIAGLVFITISKKKNKKTTGQS